MLYFPKITSNEIFYNVLFNSFEGIQDPKQDIEKKCIILLLKMAHLLLHYCYIQDSSQYLLYIYIYKNKEKRQKPEAL